MLMVVVIGGFFVKEFGSFMFLYISGSQSGRNRPLGGILRVKVAKQHKGAKTLNSMGSIVSHIIFG